jgi:hypothetical protein
MPPPKKAQNDKDINHLREAQKKGKMHLYANNAKDSRSSFVDLLACNYDQFTSTQGGRHKKFKEAKKLRNVGRGKKKKQDIGTTYRRKI